MIGVGINSDIVIKSAVINDKKRLELELIEANKVGTVKKSVFDTLLTARTAEEGTSFKLSIFGPLLPKKDDQKTEKKVELIGLDLTKLIKQLSQILEQFIPVDQIDLDSLDVQFANTGITDGASFEARILDQDVLNRIYDNIASKFITLITPFVGSVDNAVRFKLIRQSKDKHYASIPSRFIADNPFIELMTVPADQSRVKFTKWELEQGLDSGAPIAAADKAEAKQAATVDANPFAPQP
jgi:hypothetical protein